MRYELIKGHTHLFTSSLTQTLWFVSNGWRAYDNVLRYNCLNSLPNLPSLLRVQAQ